MTTEPAETTAPSPTVTPGQMIPLCPIQTLSEMVTGFTASGGAAAPTRRSGALVGCPGASNTMTSLAIRQSFPIEMRLPITKLALCPMDRAVADK